MKIARASFGALFCCLLSAAAMAGPGDSPSSPAFTVGGSVNITQTTVTLSAATSTPLIATGTRKFLCLMNTGTGVVNLAFDAAAVAGSGAGLSVAAAAGGQGGSLCFMNEVPSNAINGISTAGSTVAVLVGN